MRYSEFVVVLIVITVCVLLDMACKASLEADRRRFAEVQQIENRRFLELLERHEDKVPDWHPITQLVQHDDDDTS